MSATELTTLGYVQEDIVKLFVVYACIVRKVTGSLTRNVDEYRASRQLRISLQSDLSSASQTTDAFLGKENRG